MQEGWAPADRPEVVQVFAGEQRFLFFVLGEKRTPYSEVRITLSPEDIWPPIYNLVWRETGSAGPDVVTGYFLVACAEQGSSDYVTLRDASGQRQVKVQPVSDVAISGACEQASGVL
jgi:hypothetical protein